MERSAAAILLLVALAGCLGTPSSTTDAPADASADGTWDRPLPDEIVGLRHVTSVPDVEPGASGLWVDGRWAYVSGFDSQAFHVVDLADPTRPAVAGTLEGPSTTDAHHLVVDGRDIVVSSSNGGGLRVLDVTDRSDPRLVDTVDVFAHNVGVLPNASLAYVADSQGRGSTNEIVDVADPDDARVVATFGERGCHDVAFHVHDGRRLMTCPALDATEIWDVTDDPLDPERVAVLRNPFISAPGAVPGRPDLVPGPFDDIGPGGHHWATAARGGDLLIVGSEFTGAIAPGCGVHAEAGGRSVSDTLGALWFYDATDPADPELMGWFKMPVPEDNAWNRDWMYPSCTSHFGEVVESRDKVVVAWYHAGVALIDFSDPADPTLVDRFQRDSAAWDARLAGRYVVTGDPGRGSDILELTGR